MNSIEHGPGDHFRVWIAQYEHWDPGDHRDVPPTAVALEPAEEGTMSARQAAAYVEAFNRAALRRTKNVWAVALPVTVHYQGDPRPGEQISDLGSRI